MGRIWLTVAAGWLLSVCAVAGAQDSRQLISTLVANETNASKVRGHYSYVAEERSDRTGGHLWQERVAETAWGRVRYLVAEDGRPLNAERTAAERDRLAKAAADPEAFKRQEQARTDDEQHARQMLELLGRAFLFNAPVADGENWRIAFRPDPAYDPKDLEERVLHAMSGTILVDRTMVRTRELQGTMPQDLSIGFGLLATIKAGSRFSTVREHVQGSDWKTQSVQTDIRGKALFLKTISRQMEQSRRDYRRVSDTLTVPEAVALVEQGG